LIFKEHQLSGDIEIYVSVTYTILNNLAKREFYHEKGTSTSKKKYTKIVENLIKNFYNSKVIPEKQKVLIKADRKIKYFIIEYLTKRGFCEVIEGRFCINEIRKQVVINDFKSKDKKDLLKDIRTVFEGIIPNAK